MNIEKYTFCWRTCLYAHGTQVLDAAFSRVSQWLQRPEAMALQDMNHCHCALLAYDQYLQEIGGTKV